MLAHLKTAILVQTGRFPWNSEMWPLTQKFTFYRTHVSLFSCLVQIWLCSFVETWPMWPRMLEDAYLEHLPTLKRVKILKMLESLTAVEGYGMLWQLLPAVESCDSFYELWQLLSDVSSEGFNKLWNLRQTSSWFGLPTDRQGKTMIGPGFDIWSKGKCKCWISLTFFTFLCITFLLLSNEESALNS